MDTLERAPEAGWYDDGAGRVRWWDGERWTEHVTTPVSQTPESAAPAAEAPPPVPATPAVPVASASTPAAPAASAATSNMFLSATSFLPEAVNPPAGVAPSTSRADASEEAAERYGGAPGFGSKGSAGTFSGPPSSGSARFDGGSRGHGGLIALAVIVVLALAGIGVWRYLSGPPKAEATPSVVAAAVPAPTVKLPAGYTSAGLGSGFKVMPPSSCASGTSCRTVKLASQTTCARLSAHILFASSAGNRLGSDVVAAKNVKAGKAVALKASIRPSGGVTVRVASVVCQSP